MEGRIEGGETDDAPGIRIDPTVAEPFGFCEERDENDLLLLPLILLPFDTEFG